MSHKSGSSAAGIEANHERPGCDVAPAYDLVLALGMELGLPLGINGQGADKGQTIHEADQIVGTRSRVHSDGLEHQLGFGLPGATREMLGVPARSH